jgi:dTDP-4-amino-4,6-dideoxygalactose transaminase
MKKIKLSKSVVNKKEIAAISRVMLKDGYFGMGQEVRNFEKELKEFLETDKDVVCVNTGTSALHLAVAAVVRPGDEVLVQSLTYVASYQAISAAGATPVSCEIDPATLTIDLADAEQKLTSKTKAIMPVHYASDPGDLDKLYEFAKKHNLRVIEDAAHAFGGKYNNSLIGTIGDIICFSFDPIKNITSGDGGAIVTADKQVLKYVQDARLLGVQNDTEKRYAGSRSWSFDVVAQGFRYHMTNIFAAIGRVQLKKFPKFKKIRQQLATRYLSALSSVSAIKLLKKDYTQIVPHIFPILITNGKRDALRQYLTENGVETGVHYQPNHWLTLYKKDGVELEKTDTIYNQLLTLPLHAALTKTEQNKVVTLIKKFFSA